MPIALAVAAILASGTGPASAPGQDPVTHTIHLPVTIRPHGPVTGGHLLDTFGGEAPAWTSYPDGFVLATGRKMIVVDADSSWTVGLPGRLLALTTDEANGNVFAVEAMEEGAHGARRVHMYRPDPGAGLVPLASGDLPVGTFDVRADGGWLYAVTRGPERYSPYAGKGVAILDARTPEQGIRAVSFAELPNGVPEDMELLREMGGALYLSYRYGDPESWGIRAYRAGSPPTLSPGWGEAIMGTARSRVMVAAIPYWLQATSPDGVRVWYDPVDGPSPLSQPVVPASPCLSRALDVAGLEAGALPSFAVFGQGCIEWRALVNSAWEIERSATDDRVLEMPESGSPFRHLDGRLGVAYGKSGGFFDWTQVPGKALELPGSTTCLTEMDGYLAALAGDGLWILSPGVPEPAQRGVGRLGFAGPGRCEIALSGGHAYISADDLFTDVDLTDQTRPEAARASRLPNTVGALAADSRRSYIAAGDDGIYVRPHDRADPIAGGVARTAGSAWDAELAAGHLFVADGDAGVTVFELEGEEMPRLVGSEAAGLDVRTLRAAGDYLYGTALRSSTHPRYRLGEITFVVFDVSEPLKPELIGWVDLPGVQPGRPAIGQRGVLVPVAGALHEVDVADPTRPRWARTIDAPAVDAAGVGGLELSALGALGIGVSGLQN